jgi:hypothetical protein
VIEQNGDDVHDPLEVRTTLANVLARAGNGIRLNHHIEEDGPTVFRYARKLGLEGIVSKAEDSLPQWPIARLAQDEEPERARGATGKPRRIGAESGGDKAI